MVQETATGWLSLLHRRRYEYLHHALLAATIAAVTFALEQTHFFGSLDFTLRSVVSQIQALREDQERERQRDKGLVPTYRPEAAEDRPIVLLLPDLRKQAWVRRQSPPAFLADLIAALADKRPEMLAIDLPLDPGIDDPILDEEEAAVHPPQSAETRLRPNRPSPLEERLAEDKTLRAEATLDRERLDNALRDAARRTRLVVTAPPLPESAAEFEERFADAHAPKRKLLERRIRWMSDLCRIGASVRMALYTRPLSGIDAFARSNEVLGNVASRPWEDADPVPAQPGSVCAILQKHLPAGSDQAPRTADLGSLFEKLFKSGEGGSDAELATLNPRFFSTLSYFTFVHADELSPREPIARALPTGLKGKPVFIGERDPRVRVFQKEIAYADANAAIYYSNLHRISSPSHARLLATDVAMGTLLGFLFVWSWGLYVRATDRMDAVALEAWREKISAWAWARLVLLPANLLLLCLLVVAAWWMSNEFFRAGAWINPLPLVIGMSIKGLLGSRQRHVGHVPQSLSELVAHHPDVVWQPVVIVLAFASVALAH